MEVGGQAVLGRQIGNSTPWLTERHGYDPTSLLAPAAEAEEAVAEEAEAVEE